MILGNQPRMRPGLHTVRKSTDPNDPVETPAGKDPQEHRDRGPFLTPRLYPTDPYGPWRQVVEAVSA